MGDRFCPKCGTKISQGTFCENCMKQDIGYKTPHIQVSELNRVFEKKRWKHFSDIEELIKRRVREALKKKTAVVTVEPFEFIPRKNEKTTVYVNAKINENSFRLPVKLSYRKCDVSQKEKTGYFQGILQLRNTNDKVMPFIEKEMKKVAHKGIFISKIVSQANGVDLYFTDKSYMSVVGQRIVCAFGGELELHPQLFSHNHETSKDIYRLNIIIKLPSFTTGEVISFLPHKARIQRPQRQFVLVTSMGKKIQGKNILRQKHVSFELKHGKEYKKVPQHTTQISRTTPSIHIIAPETFQEEEVCNQDVLRREYAPQEKVIVVKTTKGWAIVK